MDYEGFSNFTQKPEVKAEDNAAYYSKNLCQRFDIPTDLIIRFDSRYIYTRITKELREVINKNKKPNKEGEIIKVGNDKEKKEGKIIYKIKYVNEDRKPIAENFKINKLTLGISKIFKTNKPNNYIFYIMVYGLKTKLENINKCIICDEIAHIKINCEQCKNFICFMCYKNLEKVIITDIKDNKPYDIIIRKCPFCRNIYNFA